MKKGLILKTVSMIILLFLCSCESEEKEIKLIDKFLPQYETEAKLQGASSYKYPVEKDSLFWENAFMNYSQNKLKLQNLRSELNSESNRYVNSLKIEKQALEKDLSIAQEGGIWLSLILLLCIVIFLGYVVLHLAKFAWKKKHKIILFFDILGLLGFGVLIYFICNNLCIYIRVACKNPNKIIVLQDAINNPHKSFEQFATYSHVINKMNELDCQISPVRDSILRKEKWIQDSIQLDLIKALPEYIRKNSFCKKMRIIACSWEKEADVPDHGSIDGEVSSSGEVSGGMLGLIGGVSGSSETTGKIKGEYKGRIYGDGYRYFHFILADNSYHMVDAKNNPEWRMAHERLLVEYRQTCTYYNDIRVTFTPLYNQSY